MCFELRGTVVVSTETVPTGPGGTFQYTGVPSGTVSGSGRRLDTPGVTFEELEATNGYHPDVGSFMLAGVDIPTEGCWEIAGHYQGYTLSYVVWVEPA